MLCELRSLSARSSNVEDPGISRKTGYSVQTDCVTSAAVLSLHVKFHARFKISDGKGFIPRPTPHLVGLFEDRKPGAFPFGTTATGPLPFLHAYDPPRSPALRCVPCQTPRLVHVGPGSSSPDIHQAFSLPVNAIEMPIAGPRSFNPVHRPDAVPDCVPDHPPGARSKTSMRAEAPWLPAVEPGC